MIGTLTPAVTFQAIGFAGANGINSKVKGASYAQITSATVRPRQIDPAEHMISHD
jgi:hypothetical protein